MELANQVGLVFDSETDGTSHRSCLGQSICSTAQKSYSEGEKTVCGGKGFPEGHGHERKRGESEERAIDLLVQRGLVIY